MASPTMRTKLLSITPSVNNSKEFKVTIALDSDENTYSARINEAKNIPLMGFDFVFSNIFCVNQQIVDQVVKAIYDFRAGRPVSLPMDLGFYYIGGRAEKNGV